MRFIFFLLPVLLLALSEIEIGENLLQVKVVDTEEERNHGLQGRTSLPEEEGMLFVFDRPQRLSFWMKDTLIPLSIGFFDENRVLLQILDMDPLLKKGPLFSYRSRGNAKYALEVSQGWFQRHQVRPGMKFSFH